MGSAKLFECNYKVICDIFNCRQPAKWFIGNPKGPLNLTLKLCDDCKKSLLEEFEQEKETPAEQTVEQPKVRRRARNE